MKEDQGIGPRGATLASVQVREVTVRELELELLPAFVDLLRDAVDGGSLLGFLPPLAHEQARDYWLSLRADLQAGTRVLLAAFEGARVVGTGQLVCALLPATRHRAELQKICVASDRRGRGIGALLLGALHGVAQQRGRSLLLLNTRHGSAAQRLYERFGYDEAGIVRGYMRDAAGKRYDSVMMVRESAG
ncbi:MAG TPA: GNAT family N-acetyltransferase [Burkholderiaceae bacterium]|nr:GNAT family N-acetyltransferase [Burkholderiaceae bacterium]